MYKERCRCLDGNALGIRSWRWMQVHDESLETCREWQPHP